MNTLKNILLIILIFSSPMIILIVSAILYQIIMILLNGPNNTDFNKLGIESIEIGKLTVGSFLIWTYYFHMFNKFKDKKWITP